jgi:hypothetical protein
MKTPHLLRASGNVRMMKENLINIISRNALSAIQSEINRNVKQLFALGMSHYNFAVRQNNRSWRQKVSRLYYASYNVSRAVRLCEDGEFSTEVADHKKVGSLPDRFPNKSSYANRLSILREDRNLCDYDHTCLIGDLVTSVPDAIVLVEEFLRDARTYIRGKGIIV